MNFDWTISLGAVLVAIANLLGMLVSGVALYYKTREWVIKLHVDNKMELQDIKGTLREMEPKLDSMWEWFVRRRNGS